MSANDTETRRPKQFLADLVRAMGEAARAARQETVEQCQSDAKAYTERLRAGTNSGAAELHKAAVADVGTIRDQSKAASPIARTRSARNCFGRRVSVSFALISLGLSHYIWCAAAGASSSSARAEVASLVPGHLTS